MSTMRFSKSAIALSLATLFSQAVLAEEPKAELTPVEVDTKEKEIEKIAVWGTSVESSSLYLKGEDLEQKQADHISDLLRTIPGVDVGGAHSLNQRITIRSMDDKDIDITIDGARQNAYMYHHMGNLQIHADILKSVDIEVGTNSVINSGLGGSVAFETKSAQELLTEEQRFGARLQAGVGDNSGDSFSVTAYGLLSDNIDFLAYYNHVNRDNYEVGGGEITDSNGDVIEGTDGTVRGMEGEVDAALLKFGWNMTDNQRLTLSYESYVDEGDYSYRPDMGLATDLAIGDGLGTPLLWPTKFSRDTFTLGYDLSFGESSQLKATLFSNTSELWRDENGWSEAGWDDYAGIITGEAKNTGANVIAVTAFDDVLSMDHEVTYGFDYVNYETAFNAAYPTPETSSESLATLAIFAQDKIGLGYGFSLIPGIRYQQDDVESAVVTDTFSSTNLAIAAEYEATDNLLFRLSTTEVYKSPEIGEVFTGAGLYDVENADIEAEHGTNAEFSIAYQDAVLGADSFSVGGTIFNTLIQDYIYDYAENPETGRYWKDNIGDMEIVGYEAYLGYQLGHLSTQITYSSAESELAAAFEYPELDGARLDRQQGDTLSASIDYEISGYNVFLHWDILSVSDVEAGKDIDGASLDNSKDAYTVQNISARWTPQSLQGLTVVLGVDNLFDEFYASQSSRTGVSFHPRFGELYLFDYEPGRNIKATVSYNF